MNPIGINDSQHITDYLITLNLKDIFSKGIFQINWVNVDWSVQPIAVLILRNNTSKLTNNTPFSTFGLYFLYIFIYFPD